MDAARARMRRCLQCHCAGDPGPPLRDENVEGVHDTLEKLLGVRPTTCLWWLMREPIVGEVLQLYRACRNDMGAVPALALPLDPPNRVWEGLLHYAAAHDRVRAEDHRQRENE